MKFTELFLERMERSLRKQRTKVADRAFKEVSEMFPTWWEQGPLQATTASIQRRLQEDATPETIEILVALTRISAEALALDCRTSTAMAKWYTTHLPQSGFRDQLLAPLSEEDAEHVRELRKVVEQYGINMDGLWAHFAV